MFSAHVDEVVGEIVRSNSEQSPVSCLIADTFFVWPSKIAKKFGLLYASYWTEPALVFTLYYHLDLLRKNGHFACPGTISFSSFHLLHKNAISFNLKNTGLSEC